MLAVIGTSSNSASRVSGSGSAVIKLSTIEAGRTRWGRGASGCWCGSLSLLTESATEMGSDDFRELREGDMAGEKADGLSSKKDSSWRGDSGEKEGNEVSDLSDGAMEDAELDGYEVNLLRARAVLEVRERWLRVVERTDCCDTERSRVAAAEVVAVVGVESSMSSSASDQDQGSAIHVDVMAFFGSTW